MQALRENLLAEIVGAVLIALAIVLWRRRRKVLAKLRCFPDVLAGVGFGQKDFQKDILAAFDSSKDVKLLVIRGFAVIGLKDALFHKLLSAKQATTFIMRVLLLDPRSPYVAKRAAEIDENTTAMSSGITYTLNEILEIKQRHGLSLDVRLYNTLPTWRMIFIDKRLYLSSYLQGKDGYDTPMYVIDKNDRSLYAAFERQFEALSARGESGCLEP